MAALTPNLSPKGVREDARFSAGYGERARDPSPFGARPPEEPDEGLSLRRHLEFAEGGAAVAFRVVHVFGSRRRVDVAAGRDRAHDIGHGDECGLALRAVERGHETVVAIFGVGRLDVLA